MIRKVLTVEEIFWRDQEERRLYEARQKFRMDELSELAGAGERGREEGRKETAKAALRKGYPIEDSVD